MRASSDGCSVTVRALVRRVLLSDATALRLWAPTGYLIQYTAPRNTAWTAPGAIIRRCTDATTSPDDAAMERAHSLAAIACGTCVREHSGEHHIVPAYLFSPTAPCVYG
jgi:hypothetical protein